MTNHVRSRFALVATLTGFLALTSSTGDCLLAGELMRFHTGGEGVFVPANLGVGDPAEHPTIIGDGSGLATYDGTPTGNEFRLDGELVGDGWDQHFGAAQSRTAGIVRGDLVFYPYRTAANPDGSGRKIHIMESRAGEVWFKYTGFFTLDPNDGEAGTLISRSGFRIVGGTGLFEDARGWVFVKTETSLADVFPDADGNLNAPFRYDFDGFIELADD
ncbi:hypothetical protein [Symmachiella dynata]|uniref:hypothetical protein n=1 Tax=Symmachiella dynata TaxID=2527995 RepID=UPI0030EDFDCC